MEFSILGEVTRGVSRTATLGFCSGLFGSLVGRVPWEADLKGKGVQEGWTLFKEEVLKAQEQAVPMCRKTRWRGRPLAWLNRKLWLELRGKKGVYVLWRKGQENHKDIVRLCREKVRRAKVQLELRLATAIKDNKKCFYKYISNQRRAKENLHAVLGAGGNLVTKEEEKGEVLNAFLASVFHSNWSCSPDTQPLEEENGDEEQKETPKPKGKWSVTCYTTHTSLWGWMGSIQGC